jgi:ribosome maturation factor RimP
LEETFKEKIVTSIRPVIEGMGLSVVELKTQGVKGTLHVDVVVYKKGGVSIDDCSSLHKTIFPKIELLYDSKDISLSISSPGINRVFKSMDEFKVFTDVGVKVLVEGENEWLTGKIKIVNDTEVILKNNDDTIKLALNLIRKAKLDNSGEVK